MFIQDIEFIDPLSQKDIESNSAIRGGASAYVSTEAIADDGKVYASAYAKAKGKKNSSVAKTRIKLGKKGKLGKKRRSIGYSAGYGGAYAADLDGVVLEKGLSLDFAIH